MEGRQSQARPGAAILLGKLVKPEMSGGLVRREMFAEFAKKLLSGMKMGLVIAPAGYGKSILLSQSYDMLSHRGVRCGWISLDTDDNDPLRLLSYFLAAVNSMSSATLNLASNMLELALRLLLTLSWRTLWAS